MDKEKKILQFLKDRSGQCFGALRIDKALGFDPRGTADGQHKSWPTHKILEELRDQGLLEQCYGEGFRYKKAS